MQDDQTGNRRSPDELWAGIVAEMTTMPDVVARRWDLSDKHDLPRWLNAVHSAPPPLPASR